MNELSLHQLLIRLGAAAIIITLHGYILAAVARLMGDRGPQSDGRLTASPLAHVDGVGAIALIFFQLGWIKPMAIDPAALRLGRLGLALCVPISLLVTVGASHLMLELRLLALNNLSDAIVPTALSILNSTAETSIWFAALNLLPGPPLTGSHLLFALAPTLRKPAASYQLYIAIAWGIAIASGTLRPLLAPAHDAAAGFLALR